LDLGSGTPDVTAFREAASLAESGRRQPRPRSAELGRESVSDVEGARRRRGATRVGDRAPRRIFYTASSSCPGDRGGVAPHPPKRGRHPGSVPSSNAAGRRGDRHCLRR
jgi:hypothetical protein